jgi:hypothetical protein
MFAYYNCVSIGLLFNHGIFFFFFTTMRRGCLCINNIRKSNINVHITLASIPIFLRLVYKE